MQPTVRVPQVLSDFHKHTDKSRTWVESMGKERCMASTTSASVTFSHLHTTLASGAAPAAFTISLSSGVKTRPSSPRLGLMTGARLGLNVALGAAQRPALFSRSTTSTAIAGDAAMPGESIPAAWIKCLSLVDGWMIQSPAVCARNQFPSMCLKGCLCTQSLGARVLGWPEVEKAFVSANACRTPGRDGCTSSGQPEMGPADLSCNYASHAGARSGVMLPTSVLERAPEKEWIDSLVSKSGTRPRHAARIFPRISSLESGSVFPSGHSC